jgi:hypothetical protein
VSRTVLECEVGAFAILAGLIQTFSPEKNKKLNLFVL